MKSEVDVEMVLCRHHIYEPRMLFEMDSFGSIFKGFITSMLNDIKTILLHIKVALRTASLQNFVFL